MHISFFSLLRLASYHYPASHRSCPSALSNPPIKRIHSHQSTLAGPSPPVVPSTVSCELHPIADPVPVSSLFPLAIQLSFLSLAVRYFVLNGYLCSSLPKFTRHLATCASLSPVALSHSETFPFKPFSLLLVCSFIPFLNL